MSFSKRQQPEFRVLVAAAWKAHCEREGRPLSPKPDRAWYEAELLAATGESSTADCNAGRDYDRAMAHFEALAGTSIRWQMKVHTGDARRILHELRRLPGAEALDESYFRGVARRMLRVDHLPELEQLSREQLILILGEVKRHLRRAARTDEAAEVDVPF